MEWDYAIIIETDSYAGNFEREMCAFVTGQKGECGVGREQSTKVKMELPSYFKRMEGYIASIPDEHGCHRPVSGGGEKFQSVEIYFNEVPEKEDLEIMKERIYKFPDIKILSISLISRQIEIRDTIIWKEIR